MSKTPITTPTTSNPTKKHRPRSSSLSLSIARSPSVLSSGLFFPSSPHPPQDEDALEDEIQHHPNVYGIHPYGNQMRRVISAGGKLDPIHDDDNIEDTVGVKASSSVSHLPAIINKSPKIPISNTPTLFKGLNEELDDHDHEHEHVDIDDGSRPLLPTRKVSFQPLTSARDIESEMDNLSESDVRSQMTYEGPFQSPDSKELLSIVFSVVGVVILAVAAGCTTIFDWIL
ncbi:hypothetical protein I203_103495 [Kwoniella mangroviensis CBS 8507]|uniref:uncharacterized protein n=1 Tax=Kwoniella mangroviensis CBS 8507 TaxID=1296122 RepID=UPI00080D7544|nr:uncharacterized protein I203_04406 [Kwoniella mangroviensis CBS 8507]OCF66828.1 hypothetical protein I203_04406 [Kwoniella mangroviensis CBS 8507]